MRVTYGWTRFVILTETRAIKIARIRLLHILIQLFRKCREGTVRTKLLKHGDSVISGGWRLFVRNYLLVGVIVNRQEARLWRERGQDIFVPTLRSYAWGLVNIQPRGEVVTAPELEREHPFRPLLSLAPLDVAEDMSHPWNFARYQGKVCLIDYGSDGTFSLFNGQAAA